MKKFSQKLYELLMLFEKRGPLLKDKFNFLCEDLIRFDWKEVRDLAIKAKYIEEFFDSTGYRITERGIQFIKNQDIQDTNKLLTLFTLVLVISTVYIGVKANDIQESQKTLTEEIAIKNYADLLIIPLYRQIVGKDKLLETNPVHLGIYIINKGRLDSGTITINLKNNFLREDYINIPNLNATGWKYIEYGLKHKDCYSEDNCESLKQGIPVGIQNLTFHIKCIFCEKVHYNISIPICIYDSKTEYSTDKCERLLNLT